MNTTFTIHLRIFYIILMFVGYQSLASAQAGHNDIISSLAFYDQAEWTGIESAGNHQKVFLNRNRNVKMAIHYEETNVAIEPFLKQKIRESGGAAIGDLESAIIDGVESKTISAECLAMHRPYHIVFIAVPYQDGYHLVELRCPFDCYDEYKRELNELLNDLRFTKMNESYMFYAGQNLSS